MLTDRDHFALAALTALADGVCGIDNIARDAYRIADAMLKERGERSPQPVTK